jgi:ABC-2 type transport system permease protein
MSTNTIIVRTELVRLLRGRWLLPLWFAFFALCAYAAWEGAAWSAQRGAAIAAIAAEERETHLARRTQIVEKVTSENKSFYGGALYATAMSFRATLPPGELALLTAGQAEGYPMAAKIFPFIASNTIFDAYIAGMENPSVLAAGRLDLAFVLVYLLPLLILAGSFDLWSFERERGMEPWLLAQPVTPARYLLAKAAARALLLVAPPALMLTAVLWVSAAPGPAALLLAGALTALYGLFWLGLAALVNLFARNAAQAALGCVAGWLVLVVLLPALALGMVDLTAAPSSAAERTNTLRAMAMQARAEANVKAAAVPELPPANAPNIPDNLRRRAVEIERGEALIRAAVQPYQLQDERRRWWMDAMRAASPAIAFQDALERLAGADAGRAMRFQAQAHDFLLQVRVLVHRYLDQDRLLTAADYDRGLPRFTFREAQPAERLGALAFDAGVMALGLALMLGIGIGHLRRRSHLTE